MIDRIFLATFTFCLLVGATLAIGSEWLVASPAAHIRVVQLERVEIVGKRLVPEATLAQTVSTETSTPRAQ